MPKHANKIDANQPEIVAALRSIGVTVWIVGQPMDLYCSWRGKGGWFEVKDGNKPPSARKLTPQQEDFMARDQGFRCVVKDIDEAINAAMDMIR